MPKVIFKVILISLVVLAAGFILKSITVAMTSALAADDSSPQHVTFVTSDSLTLHAWVTKGTADTLAFSRLTRLALLLPMLGHDHESYEPLAVRLQAKGYTTIAFDLRGHGRSTQKAGRELTYATMTNDDFALLPQDIENFFLDFKAKQPDQYFYGDLVVIGASIGANTAALLLDRPWVNRAVLLSPGKNYRGLEPARGMLPPGNDSGMIKAVYIAVSSEDAYSAESSQWLFDQYPGPKVLKKYPGQDHGTDILQNVKDADSELLDWLK